MKNLFSKTAALVIIATIVIASCQKETITNSASLPLHNESNHRAINNSVSVIDNRLVFKTFKDYENIAANTNSEQTESFLSKLNSENFISYAKNKNNTGNQIDSSKEDSLLHGVDFLKSILNPDLVVQIDKYIIKIDIIKGVSYVMDAQFSTQIKDLIAGNIDNPNIMVFNNSDAGIELLQEGVLGTVKNINNPSIDISALQATQCPVAKYREDYQTINYGDNYRMNCDLIFNNFFIYFYMDASVTNQHKFLLFFWTNQNALLWINYSVSYTIACNQQSVQTQNCTSCYSYGSSYSKTFYSGFIPLSKFTANATFYNRSAVTTRNFHIQY